MTARTRALGSPGLRGAAARSEPVRWLAAVVETARPRQWPKNLLVFAAPLAAASMGRRDGLGYALGAAVAFVAASAAVYFVNDVIDADRDRLHPVKRLRAVPSGRLPVAHALAIAAIAAALAVSSGFWFAQPGLAALITAYLAISLLYGLVLKHVPVIEMLSVASGFVLRALGGAVATNVPPSGWFLLVCCLGALMVAIAKRFSELTSLGADAARHRPVMRCYTRAWLRRGQRLTAVAMVAAYLLWAAGESGGWIRGWHLASAVALAAALWRFDWLSGRSDSRPVEDLISRDSLMIWTELGWLVMFVVGL
ncbi:MAG TPA: decaprenyl-phosphate phosphoribosyltransferase [Streptosporangiaceae bacterium]|jgi:decaprenyl-phosphate phosphoribosyltransferase